MIKRRRPCFTLLLFSLITIPCIASEPKPRQIRIGDKLKMGIAHPYNLDLAGTYMVNREGKIQFKRIVTVKVIGQSLSSAKRSIESALEPFVKEPSITLTFETKSRTIAQPGKSQ